MASAGKAALNFVLVLMIAGVIFLNYWIFTHQNALLQTLGLPATAPEGFLAEDIRNYQMSPAVRAHRDLTQLTGVFGLGTLRQPKPVGMIGSIW